MKKLIYSTFLAAIFCSTAQAQTSNVGIGTTTPGSKLTVNGSFAGAYTPLIATTYTAGENDFYMVWNGTAAGTITLPASTSGADRTGRLYFFKNTNALYTLTIDANGTELIDSTQVVLLQPGETALLVKTNINTATGTTYEVVQIGKNKASYYLSVLGSTTQTLADGANVKADFTDLEYSTDGGADFNMATDVWTCPQTGVYKFQVEGGGNPTVNSVSVWSHAGLHILKNTSTYMASVYYLMGGGPANAGSLSATLTLNVGDQIHVDINLCSGCGTGMNSFRRRLEISRL